MKKIILILVATVFVTIGCDVQMDSQSEKNSQIKDSRAVTSCGEKCVVIDSIFAEDGEANIFWVNSIPNGRYADPIRVGKFLGYDYRGFFSFDTSVIPDNAVVTFVGVAVSYERTNGAIVEENYLKNNMQWDIAPSTGFGYNQYLTVGDYNATAAYSVMLSEFLTDLYSYILPSSSYAYINKTGRTQIRMKFVQNPENYALNMFGVQFVGYDAPKLTIRWE